ncbi:hypothetical protein, partial [Mesorhizobium sp. M0522]|uniref:hypothetical protein n=1 Tax=Mesorhizobium sp. M0522 TaxID=2956958 RepID=UPI003339A493
IFPNLAKNVTPDGPNQLWVSDITYVTIAELTSNRIKPKGQRQCARPDLEQDNHVLNRPIATHFLCFAGKCGSLPVRRFEEFYL